MKSVIVIVVVSDVASAMAICIGFPQEVRNQLHRKRFHPVAGRLP